MAKYSIGIYIRLSLAREEFFDDGYSGTNFARPSFEKMMEKVKKGKINLINGKGTNRNGWSLFIWSSFVQYCA